MTNNMKNKKSFDIYDNWATSEKVTFKDFKKLELLFLMVGFVSKPNWMAFNIESKMFYVGAVTINKEMVLTDFYNSSNISRKIYSYKRVLYEVTVKIINDEEIY